MSKKISIIIPVYKVELDYLEVCLNSVVNQTYHNYECIILSDGANQTVVDYIEKKIKGNKKFIFINKSNSGVADTRNLGIKKASGEYITFLDADDWLEENALQKFIDVCGENFDFYIFKTKVIKNDLIKKYFISNDYNHIIGDNEKYKLFQSVYGSKKGGYHWIESVWAKFYRKDFILKNKIEFIKNIKIGEDLLFNIDVWTLSGNGFFACEEIYNYRINESSVMNGELQKVYNNYNEFNVKYFDKISKIDHKYKYNAEMLIFKEIKKYFFNYDYKSMKDFYFLIEQNELSKYLKKVSIVNLDIVDSIILVFLRYRFTFGLYLLKKLLKIKRKIK